MGKLSILNSMGDVEISWTDAEIRVNLNPEGHSKANKKERLQIGELMKEISSGWQETSFLDKSGRKLSMPSTNDIPNNVTDIKIERSVGTIKEIMKKVFKSDILSNNFIFRIKDNGKGELIQKSDFEPNGNYVASKPLAGG